MSGDANLERLHAKILALINKPTNTIGLELTTYCPLDCSYCSRRWLDRKDQDVSWEQFLALKPKLERFERVVLCGMGETMSYRHIYDVVDHLTQRVVIITSGTVPINYERLNRNRNVEVIVFSLDSPYEDEMRAITGNYNWKHLLQNLENRTRRPSHVKMINCTVTRANYKQIPELARFAVEHRLQAISYTRAILHTEQNDIAAEIQEYLQEAKRICQRGGVIYTDSFTHLKCVTWGNVVPYVNLQGNLYPCCHGVDRGYKVGNFFEQDFDAAWESEAYRQFRTGDICMHSCPLFEDKAYQVTGGPLPGRNPATGAVPDQSSGCRVKVSG
jgi:MoaA/NifB/PqqE/SkfB family radical SAM enzyme